MIEKKRKPLKPKPHTYPYSSFKGHQVTYKKENVSTIHLPKFRDVDVILESFTGLLGLIVCPFRTILDTFYFVNNNLASTPRK